MFSRHQSWAQRQRRTWNCLEDVFTVLGRDTEQFEKLKQLDYLVWFGTS